MSRILLALTLVLMSALAAPAASIPERDALMRRAAAVRPNEGDFRWQQIPWQIDPAEALKLARDEQRPLFVWLAGGRDRDGSPLERC
ncbi:hypothetical protein [Fimbriiglobus ruber]|uniref:Uncharacterized protein n=1 Tax=Fimbriiglobus ruber TaxID=1908690 RepID=A0A225DDH0_9BACT|nr:hypothetical protein [Fimbriiglobus ruber]OWK37684.1 hypothetical protein FRUB_06804 [Fimbriiglobus ruber]